MRKYLYLIKKQKIKSWLKFWLLTRDKVNYILSEIIEGTSFNLQNTVKRYFKIFNIFGNSVQDGTPSPENPVPINSVADDVNLWELSSSYTTSTGSEYVIRDTSINKIPADTYVLSLKKSVNVNMFFNFKDSLNQEYTVFLDSVENTTINFTSDIVKVAIYIYGNQACTISNIKLQKGSIATPYSPYNQGTFTIDFEGQTENYNYTFITKPFRSLPNGVRDSLEADGIHRRVGKIVLNGTETWEEAGTQYTGLYSAFIYIDDMKKQEGYNGDLLSNYFKENDFSTQEEGITKSSNPTSFALILIRLSNDNATNMTTFKNWLSNNPTELLYELATEVIEPYTEEQQEQYNKIKELYTFDGTTNIYSNDVVPPYLQIQYYMKGE